MIIFICVPCCWGSHWSSVESFHLNFKRQSRCSLHENNLNNHPWVFPRQYPALYWLRTCLDHNLLGYARLEVIISRFMPFISCLNQWSDIIKDLMTGLRRWSSLIPNFLFRVNRALFSNSIPWKWISTINFFIFLAVLFKSFSYTELTNVNLNLQRIMLRQQSQAEHVVIGNHLHFRRCQVHSALVILDGPRFGWILGADPSFPVLYCCFSLLLMDFFYVVLRYKLWLSRDKDLIIDTLMN